MAIAKYTTPSASIDNREFRGGLNTTSGPLTLQDTETPDCQNIDFDKFGAFLKRNGYSALNTSAFNSGATWTSLHWYELSNQTQYLIGTCGNKLANQNSLDGTWNDITGALTITAGNNNLFDWDTFLDTALGTNGIDPPIQWTGTGNGSAMTVPATLTKAAFVKVFNAYTFLANVTVGATVSPSRIYWSGINSITSWSATDFTEISKNDGQVITGLKVLGERLVIFKNRSIWIGLFTGDVDVPFIFQKSNSHVGADSHWSIQEAENGLIFHAQDGFYYFDGLNSYKMSDRITSTLTGYAQNRFPYITSCYQKEKNRYWSSFTSGGNVTNNRTITYDSYNNAFSLYTGLNPNCFAIVRTAGQERVYFGDYSGYVYRADTGTDDYPANVQTAISAYYYTKWYDEGDLVNQKGTPEVVMYFDYNSATITFSYSYDLNNSDTYSISIATSAPGSTWDSGLWDTATWGASGGNLQVLNLDGRGRVVRFKISNATLSETFKINGIGKFAYLETNV